MRTNNAYKFYKNPLLWYLRWTYSRPQVGSQRVINHQVARPQAVREENLERHGRYILQVVRQPPGVCLDKALGEIKLGLDGDCPASRVADVALCGAEWRFSAGEFFGRRILDHGPSSADVFLTRGVLVGALCGDHEGLPVF